MRGRSKYIDSYIISSGWPLVKVTTKRGILNIEVSFRCNSEIFYRCSTFLLLILKTSTHWYTPIVDYQAKHTLKGGRTQPTGTRSRARLHHTFVASHNII